MIMLNNILIPCFALSFFLICHTLEVPSTLPTSLPGSWWGNWGSRLWVTDSLRSCRRVINARAWNLDTDTFMGPQTYLIGSLKSHGLDWDEGRRDYIHIYTAIRAFWAALMINNLPVSVGYARNSGLISVSGRYPRVGNGNPLQYSCLESLMERKAWWVTVHGATESQTWLSS